MLKLNLKIYPGQICYKVVVFESTLIRINRHLDLFELTETKI